MRRILLAFAAATLMTAQAQTFEDAYSAVANMGPGWNLGNTLDANSGDPNNMWIEAWGDTHTLADYETAWGETVTTRQLIHMFKEAGFKTVRVPVTWYHHMGDVNVQVNGDNAVWTNRDQWLTSTNYTVDRAWMDRVHEVVDYVIDEGMYCILNVHHDTGTAGTAWLKASEDNYNAQKDRFASLWTQIANEFKNYDQRLLFEGYNEMLDPLNSWCYASFSANGQYDYETARSAYSAVNKYAQTFVNTVRATGGNNAQRNLIVNTYCGACGTGNWQSHLTDPLTQMARPTDSAQDHIIFEVHFYPSSQYGVDDMKNNAEDVISKLKTHLVSKGAPVIFGEWGAADDQNPNWSAHEEFSRYFVERARQEGMATMYWMLLSDGDDRNVPQWTRPALADAIIKGWYGPEGYVPTMAGTYGSDDNMLTYHDEPLADHEANHVAMHTDGSWRANHIALTDAKPFEAPTDITADKVTYTRTFAHDQWQALYLPYNMAYADWADLAKVYRINDIHQFDNDDNGVFDEMVLEVQRVTSGELQAHTPYLVRPLVTGTVTFESYDVTVSAYDPAIDADGYVDCSSTQHTYTIGGVYQPKADMNGIYALASGTFMPGSPTTAALSPNRIYMTITPRSGYSSSPSPAPSRIAVHAAGEPDDTTGTIDITIIPADDVYYDLMGRRVVNPTPGIYVKDGKKVYIK